MSIVPKFRAVGTAGAPGQAHGVYAKQWKCTECSADNFPSREQCYRCKAERPPGAETQPTGLAPVEDSPWREVLDTRTRQIYYWNRDTNSTSWARPAELGPAPYATGFFGRGTAGVNAQAEIAARNAEWLKRPARKQATVDHTKLQRAEGSNEYNIWYNKYIGDSWNVHLGKDPAPTRCILDTDAGFTKASRHSTDAAYFCLHFSRGACAKGHECTYYHHVPTAADDAGLPAVKDIFGRDKHTTHRDDMAGVGAIEKDCRTLYVGGLKRLAGLDLDAQVRKHFGQWGELENCNVILRLSIAFVRFRCRANAEIAREAMRNQPMEHNEVLNVRWAYDDPNPVAKESALRADVDAALAAIVSKGHATEPAAFDYPAQYALPGYAPDVYADGALVDSGAVGAIVAAAAAASAPAEAAPSGHHHRKVPGASVAAVATEAMRAASGGAAVAPYPDTFAQFAAAGEGGTAVADLLRPVQPPPLASYVLSDAVDPATSAAAAGGSVGVVDLRPRGLRAAFVTAEEAAAWTGHGDAASSAPTPGGAGSKRRRSDAADEVGQGPAPGSAPPLSAATAGGDADAAAAAQAAWVAAAGLPPAPPADTPEYAEWYYKVYAPAYYAAVAAAAAAGAAPAGGAASAADEARVENPVPDNQQA